MLFYSHMDINTLTQKLGMDSSRLSGLSPFLGDDDSETLNNILQCQWNFEEDEFIGISEEAKDFISKLLLVNKWYLVFSFLAFSHVSAPHSKLTFYFFISMICVMFCRHHYSMGLRLCSFQLADRCCTGSQPPLAVRSSPPSSSSYEGTEWWLSRLPLPHSQLCHTCMLIQYVICFETRHLATAA